MSNFMIISIKKYIGQYITSCHTDIIDFFYFFST